MPIDLINHDFIYQKIKNFEEEHFISTLSNLIVVSYVVTDNSTIWLT